MKWGVGPVGDGVDDIYIFFFKLKYSYIFSFCSL